MSEDNKGLFKKTKSVLLNILGWFDKPLEKLGYNILLLAFFSTMYYYFVEVKDEDKLRMLTLEEAIYFTFTTHFTVGFGDFSPANTIGRGIYMAHIALVWIVNMVPAGLLEDFYDETSGQTMTKVVLTAPQTRENSMSENRLPINSSRRRIHPGIAGISETSTGVMSDKDLLNLALQSNLNLNKTNVD